MEERIAGMRAAAPPEAPRRIACVYHDRDVPDLTVAAMNYMSRYRWFVKHMLERDSVFYPIRAVVQALRRVGVVEGG